MNVIDLNPSRNYPDAGTVGSDTQSLAANVQNISDCLDIYQRNTRNLVDSFLRIGDFVDMGWATLNGKRLIPTDFSFSLTTFGSGQSLLQAPRVLYTLTAGSGVSFSIGAGGITISATGSGGTVTSVDITPPAAGITASGGPITTAGSITLALANDLAALEGLGSTGIAVRTAADTWAQRSIAGTAARVSVTNGSGVAGNPTVDIDAAYVGQTSITTLGTITAGTWTATKIGLAYGGTNADLSATGGTSQVLRQSSVGGPITVSQLAYSDISGTPTGAALTKTDDTNVTLTLGGSPSTALLNAASLTLGWTGLLSVARGGSGAGTLTGYLKGNGTSAFTAAATVPTSDISGGAALTKTDDTNVTLALGGTPTTALLVATSLTLGWTGTLAVSRGGSGAGTLTGYLKGNGTSAFTASTTVPTTDLTGTLQAAQFPALTGDVTTSAGSLATTIANAAVSLAKMANLAANSIIGNNTGSPATPLALTVAQVQTMLSVPALANPSGLIGMSAVNGTATTATRSDGTHAIDPAIAPTWTALHTFTRSSSPVIRLNQNAASLPAVSAGTLIQIGAADGVSASFTVESFANQPVFKFRRTNTTAASPSNLVLSDIIGNLAYLGWGTTQYNTGVQVQGIATETWSDTAAGSKFRVTVTPNTTLTARAAFQIDQDGTISAWGPTAAALVDVTPDHGTFTGTLTGMTGSVTGTCRWNRVGDCVYLFLPIMTGTSNTTAMTMTGLPAAIQPARTQMFPVGDLENNTILTGTFAGQVAAASGTLTFYINGNAAGFTASGTKGIAAAQVVTWTLF